MKLTSVFTLAALTTLASADLKGFDISQPQSSSFWSCMHSNGFNKVAIRIYQEACGPGGQVDPNFLASYNAAKAAGFSAPNGIDGYMFPCM
jgi:hypothetical protein